MQGNRLPHDADPACRGSSDLMGAPGLKTPCRGGFRTNTEFHDSCATWIRPTIIRRVLLAFRKHLSEPDVCGPCCCGQRVTCDTSYAFTEAHRWTIGWGARVLFNHVLRIP